MLTQHQIAVMVHDEACNNGEVGPCKSLDCGVFEVILGGLRLETRRVRALCATELEERARKWPARKVETMGCAEAIRTGLDVRSECER